jgi:hypothetical protein
MSRRLWSGYAMRPHADKTEPNEPKREKADD